MEEKKRPGIPEGKESEYYAGDLALRHPKEEKPSVVVPGKTALFFARLWNGLRRGILVVFSLGGAYALTNPEIRERLYETIKNFITFSGGH